MAANNTQAPVFEFLGLSNAVLSTFTFLQVLTTLVGILGCITNVLNLLAFRKLLSGDPINYIFFFLALSDFFSCLVQGFMTIAVTDSLATFFVMKFRWIPIEVIGFTLDPIQKLFIRISILMTMLLTCGRCVSVKFPLKSKVLVTRQTILGLIGASYILCCLPVLKVYLVNRLEMMPYPGLNGTYLRRVVNKSFLAVNAWYTPLDVAIFQIIPYVLIFVSSSILIHTLKKQSLWRKKSVTATVERYTTARETKVIRMVIIVAVVFVTCNLKNVISFMATALGTVWNVNEIGKHPSLLLLAAGTQSLDSVNACANFFIYYKHSNNFKRVIDAMFRRDNIISKSKN